MSKGEIIYTQSWIDRACSQLSSKELEDSIKNELFNFHWGNTSKLIIEKLELGQDSRIFDAGCGWGRILIGIKYYLPNVKIDGIDLSPDFVKTAISLLEVHGMQSQVRLSHGNLVECKLENGIYDAFYSVRVLHYIADKQSVLSKLYDSLKVGGKGIVILPNSDCIYNRFTYKHAPIYSIRDIKSIMKEVGFKNIQTGSYGFIPPWLDADLDSPLYNLELGLRKIPFANKSGGLAYVVGQK